VRGNGYNLIDPQHTTVEANALPAMPQHIGI